MKKTRARRRKKMPRKEEEKLKQTRKEMRSKRRPV
jgi:hypothetical protein